AVEDGENRILAHAGLSARKNTPMSRLSGGEAARLFIAAAVVHEPALLFLDEPTAHLDPASKREVGELLKELGQRCTVVLTTHDPREGDGLCDRLLFLVGGRIRASGSREELVGAVPESARTGLGVEDAFFHFCAVRIREGGAEES